jgi:hypothetical protein
MLVELWSGNAACPCGLYACPNDDTRATMFLKWLKICVIVSCFLPREHITENRFASDANNKGTRLRDVTYIAYLLST